MSAVASSYLADNLSRSPPTQMQFNPPRSFINLNLSDARQAPAQIKKPPSRNEPPPGMSYAEFLRNWTDLHVARWLAEIKCSCHEEAFKANDIRGDVLLELDQAILKELGIASIGDKLRILNAVKILRQRVTGKSPATHRPTNSTDSDSKTDLNGVKSITRRLESVRPAPLQLNSSTNRGDLPGIAREQAPDSARSVTHPPIRPLPLPNQTTPPSNAQLITPNSAHSTTSGRPHKLPSLPPPPRTQPPLPPSATRTGRSLQAWSQSEAPAYTNQPPPPPPQTTSGVTRHLPADPRPGNLGGKPIARTISPVPPVRARSNTPGALHVRNGSSGLPYSSPSKSTTRPIPNAHPYAITPHTLNTPSPPSHSLSPIDESFTHHPSTPSPPNLAYTVGRGPFNPPNTSNNAYSLDDLRRKLVKFVVPEEGHTFTLDVATCNGGIEVLEKVLKKYGKNSLKVDSGLDVAQTEGGGLVVDGWGVYMDMGQEDSPGEPLTEGQLLSICHAPDHPTRENGLILRRTRVPAPVISTRNTKRASSISVLSGLGVPDPEKALESSSIISGRSSPVIQNTKRPSKLRNFFGQRPPSELITNHLTEYFPNTEKRVLARTARNSMMFRPGAMSARRDSTASFNPQLASRFSGSTQDSGTGRRSYSPSRASVSTLPPPVPEKSRKNDTSTEDFPRVSLSMDDGRSVDLRMEPTPSLSVSKSQLLPPIPFPTESLSESIDDIARDQNRISMSAKHLNYMTELRSKRDRSDTASLITVDEITASVESRRASRAYDAELDGWTKIDTHIESMVPKAVAPDEDSEEEMEQEEVDDSADSTLDSEEETLNEGELNLDVDDEGVIHNVPRANKWIKGALIGAGSFGKVYLGMDASTGFLMAVKQVELPQGSGPNQERKKSMLSALEREIELLKNLEHENIVQYLYSSLDDEFLNIFLEYVPGGSVTSLLRNYGAFEEPLVKNFVRQILQGLNYLHERDIVHRDIKGANILVDNRGGIKISDFGISKKVDDNLLTGNRMNRPSLQGSVFWMAPEVVKQTGHTRKADIWSVGCLVVEMLTGEHPWAQLTQMQAIFQIGSSAKPAIPSDISADAQDFLRRTFEINHEARPSASELLQHSWVVAPVKPTK